MLPPLVGVAVKVTLSPAQIVFWLAVILTLGVTSGLIVIVIAGDVAVVGEAQASLEVNITDTSSPLARVELL